MSDSVRGAFFLGMALGVLVGYLIVLAIHGRWRNARRHAAREQPQPAANPYAPEFSVPGMTLVLRGRWVIDICDPDDDAPLRIIEPGEFDLVPDTGAVIVNEGDLRLGGSAGMDFPEGPAWTPWWFNAAIFGALAPRILEQLATNARK